MRAFWLSALSATVVGLAAAYLADGFLAGRTIPLVGSFVMLRYTRNAGIAWGLRFPDGLQEVIIGTALVGVTVVAARSVRSAWDGTGFGLVVGGGMANALDRLQDGFVTDMFAVGFLPVFNVADTCITAGAVMLGVSVMEEWIRKGRRNTPSI